VHTGSNVPVPVPERVCEAMDRTAQVIFEQLARAQHFITDDRRRDAVELRVSMTMRRDLDSRGDNVTQRAPREDGPLVLVAVSKPGCGASHVRGGDVERGWESVCPKDRQGYCFKVTKAVVESKHDGSGHRVANATHPGKIERGDGLIPLGGKMLHLDS